MGGGPFPIRRMQDADVTGKTVLVRVDYNVPLQEGRIVSDERIRASLPTLDDLLARGAKLVLVTHLGRPGGKPDPALRLDPIAARLEELLSSPVRKLDDCIGPDVASAIAEGREGDVFLLENVRFHREETTNEAGFARQLAGSADIFVNDAFASLHRAHASTLGVADYLPAYAGLLMQREIEALSKLTIDPQRPYIAIIGGKKARSKLGALRDLLSRVDGVLIGGGVAFTFLRAGGAAVGSSEVDEGLLDEIPGILSLADELGVKIDLPEDVVIAQEVSGSAQTEIADARAIPEGWIGLDIGPGTIRRFGSRIEAAKTIIWAGPMGAFEFEPFSTGTRRIAEAVAGSDAFSVIGGGETGEAIERFGLADRVSYISTGGGATLAFLRGKTLPALEALRK